MGQKTNPTLLRLEKTNQHYKACWYSDRFYCQQLHSNYKTCDYIDKIFYKIKQTKNLLYIKAGHNTNQLFCIFPKKRIKRFTSWKSGRQINVKKAGLSRWHKYNHRLTLLYVLLGRRLPVYEINSNLSHKRLDFTEVPNKWPRANKLSFHFTEWYKKRFLPPLQVSGLWHPASVLDVHKSSPKTFSSNNLLEPIRDSAHTPLTAKVGHENMSPLTVAIFCKHSLALPTAGGQADSQNQSNLVRATKNNHHSHMERVIDCGNCYSSSKNTHWHNTYLPNLGSKHVAATPNFEPTGATVKANNSITQNVNRITNFTKTDNQKNTQICFVKTSHLQQNCSLLTQKIINSLKNRIAFQRLRKQILWDVSKSKYVKGIRVTLSGRVDSKSKKAQKARARTFQWGQTELHVLSSLVQFTKEDCITPFGKIGIKVWICYGT